MENELLKEILKTLDDIRDKIYDIDINIEHIVVGKTVPCPANRIKGCKGDGKVILRRYNLGFDGWYDSEEERLVHCAQCEPEEWGLKRLPKKRTKK